MGWSGRGLYVLWLLRPAPRAALPKWAAVQKYLTATLADLGADPAAINAARLLRLGGATVRLVKYRIPGEKQAIRYEPADLARQYLPAEWHTSARVTSWRYYRWRENHRGFDLPVGNRPVGSQEPVLLFHGNHPEAVLLIEPDGPDRVRPGADQDRARGLPQQVGQLLPPDALVPVHRPYVGVPDEGDVPDILNTHHPLQSAVGLIAPEDYTGVDLVLQLFFRHIGFMVAVGRDNPPVGLGGVVDNRVNFGEIRRPAGTDQENTTPLSGRRPAYRPPLSASISCKADTSSAISSGVPTLIRSLPARRRSLKWRTKIRRRASSR